MAKILVIEDEEMVAQAVIKKLQANNFEVVHAADGESALSMAQSENPDLILLDMILPKVDGVAVLKSLKSDEKTASIPVIVLSNLSDTGNIPQDLRNKVAEYLVKTDSSLDEILGEVMKTLSPQGQPKQ